MNIAINCYIFESVNMCKKDSKNHSFLRKFCFGKKNMTFYRLHRSIATRKISTVANFTDFYTVILANR